MSVEITCNSSDNVLNIRPYGNNFQEIIETLKVNGCRWDSTDKFWHKSIADFDDLVKELVYCGETIDCSELTKKQIAEWQAHLVDLELSTTRRRLNFDLMKFMPLKGIGDNENYQREDLSRAINQNRFLFNWQMGLGKSYALACLIENLRYYKLIDKALIFSTGVGVFNLKDELLKFSKTLKDEDILVLNSLTDADYEDRDIFNYEKYPQHIIIMTYDSFKGINNYYYDKEKGTAKNPKPSTKTKYRDSYVPMKDWLEGHNGGLFLDEVHSLGNPKSRRSEIFKMNIDYFKYRYLFTGTLADKYEKLYEPLYILDKSLVNGKTYSDWLSSYCELGNRWSKYAVNDNSWDLEKINELNKKLLKTYASKRLMNECLDLPLNYEVPTINIDMSAAQRKIYEAFVKEQVRASNERKKTGEATQKDSLLNMFQIFQLAVDNPECIKNSDSFELFPEELQKDICKFDYSKDCSKLNVADEILAERVGEYNERGILWYYHPVTKDALAKRYAKYKPIIIEAGLSNEERNARIKEFKTNPEHKLIIGSINIMNTSITLTECTFEIYIEKTYNFTDYTQSRGRIWRPGQLNMTRTYEIVFRNSIDNLQSQNLKSKGALMSSLLNKQFIGQDTWRLIFNANQDTKFE